jgi:hypothetical protein
MPRKYAKPWEEPPPRKGPNPLRRAWHAACTILIVVLLLYVSGLVIGRTEGFRALVAQRLEKVLEMPVKIEGTSLDARYGLTLKGVVTEGTRRANSPGLRAQRVAVSWRWGDVFRRGKPGIARLELDKPVIVFELQENGDWAPAPLAPLSAFLAKQLQFSLPTRTGAAPAAPASESAFAPEGEARAARAGVEAALSGLKTEIVITRGELAWWTEQPVPVASVEGVSLQATPVAVPGRALTHYLLKVARAASVDGPGIRDLVVELLDTGDQQVVLRFHGEHSAPPRPKP